MNYGQIKKGDLITFCQGDWAGRRPFLVTGVAHYRYGADSHFVRIHSLCDDEPFDFVRPPGEPIHLSLDVRGVFRDGKAVALYLENDKTGFSWVTEPWKLALYNETVTL